MAARRSGAIMVDTTSFDKEFVRIVNEAMPELAAQGLQQQAFQMIKYAIVEEPRCPHDTGRLWNSNQVDKPEIKRDRVGVRLGFNVSYAAEVHEAPAGRKWKLPGAGPKYLETKLISHREEVMEKTAEFIKRGAK